MTAYIYSVAWAVPAAHRDAANAAAEAFGWQDVGAQPGTFSVPLGAAGTVTHYGTLTRATQTFIDTLASPPAGFEALAGVILSDVRECGAGDGPQHWQDFLSEHGLTPADEV